MSEATGLQISSLIAIANSTAGHVVLPDYMRTDILEAASTIRDLDLAVDKLIEERDEAFKKIDELQDVCGDSADRMVELRKERDEARREAATFYARQFYKDDAVDRMSRIYAEECGWDCFKDNA